MTVRHEDDLEIRMDVNVGVGMGIVEVVIGDGV
jgi:hypothetical protein